eukprot:CAMPEP_0114689434 /NCGR_PEP_ID=MMETSP0191-20121206/64527_1 /TAXON_ID=126664 /ORGANISM="Sorites sp." /LENGTH=108 /DNA_ID=CAMNT_0001978019 /DNA_START=43 /DNA_END=366 /DNA_ORIENTATION=+
MILVALTLVISGAIVLSITGLRCLCLRQENQRNKDHSDQGSPLARVISSSQERKSDDETKNDIETNVPRDKSTDESIFCGEGGCTAVLSKCKTSTVYANVPGMNNDEW